MSVRLDSKPQIRTLALDLGLPDTATPCRQILQSVETRVRRVKKKFGSDNFRSLLAATANEVGTVFREIHSDDDIIRLQEEYLSKGELIFGNLTNDLGRPDDYGITIALHHQKPWELPFVSIIDCRGVKRYRSYFTKWHELAHLLTLTPQMRLVFRRSHSREDSQDPEEKLMDVIASSVGFLPDLLPQSTQNELSFEAIEEIKREFCPDASAQAAMIGIVKAFPSPCILLEATTAHKKGEQPAKQQSDFGFPDSHIPALRAIHATVSTAGREAGLQFFANWRVPVQSIITSVFEDGCYREAEENLAWWSTSSGRTLEDVSVRVKAKRVGRSVQALLIPISESFVT